MPDDRRLELRVSSELLVRVDEARGDVLRGTWVKRVLEQALKEPHRGSSMAAVGTSGEKAATAAVGGASPVPASASARAPGPYVARNVSTGHHHDPDFVLPAPDAEPDPVDAPPPPKIARKHWSP